MEIKRVITKETSGYNKAMKWHLVEFSNSGGRMSSWYKTQSEAEYAKNRHENIVGKYTTALRD